jgi:Ca-activated chloride channel family protein
MKRVLLAIVVAASTAVAAASQAPVQFRAQSDIVEVHATVKLRNGTIAHDLTRDDFELLEDGKPREITVFSRSVQPLSVALILDHSGSTDPEFENVMTAAQEFVGHLLRDDRSSIATLTWDCQPFTNDQRALMTVLRMNLPRDFGSPIWSATDRAMSSLAPEGGRRIILLLSDGQDNQMRGVAVGAPVGPPPPMLSGGVLSPCEFTGPGEFRTANDIVARAEREAIMVYTVSVGSGSGDLGRLSRQTGASYQELGQYSELKNAFRSIADELHLQYVLGFAPSFFDGKLHKIEVRTKRAGVTVHARKGYLATVK